MNYRNSTHQYIDRLTGKVLNENLYHDRIINSIYSDARENHSILYRILTSRRMTDILAFINYDMPMGKRVTGGSRFLKEAGIDTSEFLDPPETLDTSRKFFERKIRYHECRPMSYEDGIVLSPADSRMLIGSFAETENIFIKEKFFSFEELLGNRPEWHFAFRSGDFAVFRLTPEKYHYSHFPVTGTVADFYEIEGGFNSCNPGAVSAIDGAYSKNRRAVTIIDTDTGDGTGIGMVAMIEVAALMIGGIVQCYSETGYKNAVPVTKGMQVRSGAVKSLFRPGSSVDLLLFQKGRVRFSDDLVHNSFRRDVNSRFSAGFGRTLVETDVNVRSEIGRKLQGQDNNDT